MTITTCLTVSSGLQDIEVEIEVECTVRVLSYTPGEPATRHSAGEPEQIEWECHLARAVVVADAVVMPVGTLVELSAAQGRALESDLIAAGRRDRDLARAGV